MLQIMTHPSVISMSSGEALSSCSPGTTPSGVHRAHGNKCVFSQSVESLRLCVFGSGQEDHPCPECRLWSQAERKLYRQALREFGISARIDKPACWSTTVDVLFSSDDAYGDMLLDHLDVQPPQGSSSQAQHSSVNSSSVEVIQQLQSPDLLRTLRALQDPAFQSAIRGLSKSSSSGQDRPESYAGSIPEEEQDPSKIEVLQWAKSFCPEMIYSSSSVSAGSFAFRESLSETSKLRGDEGVMGAFLRGLNIHRKIPESAQIPEEIIPALQSSSVVPQSAQRRLQYPSPFRPIRASNFHFTDPTLQSLLSRDALNPYVSPHPDWGSSSMPGSSCPQWGRTAEGLSLHLEAAALVDLLVKAEGDRMDLQGNQMLKNLRHLILSSATILGTFGHDALLARREQILEKFKLPNRINRLQEPFLPGNLLGPGTSADIQAQRDPLDRLTYCVSRLARDRQPPNQSSRGRGRSFRNSDQGRPNSFRYNPYRNQLSSNRGRGSQSRGRGRGSPRQSSSSSSAPPSQRGRRF